MLGGVGGGQQPWFPLELLQEHCLPLSEGKQKQAVTQRQIFPVCLHPEGIPTLSSHGSCVWKGRAWRRPLHCGFL